MISIPQTDRRIKMSNIAVKHNGHDTFVIRNGVKIAKLDRSRQDHPGPVWIALKPGFSVHTTPNADDGTADFFIEFENVKLYGVVLSD
jgi:hypothetical protein